MESKHLTSDSEKELADSLRVARNSGLVLIGKKTQWRSCFRLHRYTGYGENCGKTGS